MLPLVLMIIPAIGIASAAAATDGAGYSSRRIAVGLLPLAVLAIPAKGIATRLLPLMCLTITAVSVAPGLGRGDSLTIWLWGNRTTRSGLGA